MWSALKRMREALAIKNENMGRPMTSDGAEIHDPTPVAPPVGYNPSLSFEERIRQTIRSEQLAHMLDNREEETLADMHDFGDETDDDEIFPASRFEQVALDAQRMGVEYRRSKAERDRLEQAEDRLAKKIADAVQVDKEFEELEEARRPQRRSASSGARRREAPEGRTVAPQPPSRDDGED